MHVVLQLNICKVFKNLGLSDSKATSQSFAPSRPIWRGRQNLHSLQGKQAPLRGPGLDLACEAWPIHSQGGHLANSFISCPKWTSARTRESGKIPAPGLCWIGGLSVSTGELLGLQSRRTGVPFDLSGRLPSFNISDSDAKQRAQHLENASNRAGAKRMGLSAVKFFWKAGWTGSSRGRLSLSDDGPSY